MLSNEKAGDDALPHSDGLIDAIEKPRAALAPADHMEH